MLIFQGSLQYLLKTMEFSLYMWGSSKNHRKGIIPDKAITQKSKSKFWHPKFRLCQSQSQIIHNAKE